MNIIKAIPSILIPLLLMTGCGDDVIPEDTTSDSSGIDVKSQPTEGNTTNPKDQNNTVPIVDNNATFDFKDYFPKLSKTVNCQLSTTNLNLNPTITYGGDENNISVNSDYDGLDLFEYTVMKDYMSMGTDMKDRRTFTWFDDKFVYLNRENNVTSRALRYFEDNASMILSLKFEIVSNFTISSGSEQGTYTDAYINDSLFCIAKALGDYNVSSTLYADALEINCSANHSKGGTINNNVVTVYNDDYNSSTVFLPDIGMVSTKYISRDMNFSVNCQP